MQSSPIVRTAWGSALVLFPETLVHRLLGAPPSQTGRVAARALGARHMIQGIAAARGAVPPSPWAAGPDLLHAVSMATLALRSSRWRRAALTDGVVAAVFVLVALRTSRPAAHTRP